MNFTFPDTQKYKDWSKQLEAFELEFKVTIAVNLVNEVFREYPELKEAEQKILNGE